MFGKVKKWLGIEGVKLELEIPDSLRIDDGKINGKVRLYTKSEATITSITIKVIERYSRGRNKDKLTDEYEMGSITMKDFFNIPENEPIELEFEVPFEVSKSEMDELENRNILFGGLVKAAKWMRGVNSEYRVEAYATVTGSMLDPFDKKGIVFE